LKINYRKYIRCWRCANLSKKLSKYPLLGLRKSFQKIIKISAVGVAQIIPKNHQSIRCWGCANLSRK